MKTFLFGTLLFGSLLHAITLDALIENALQDNPSLHSMSERIAASKESVNLASEFSNPEIALRVSDINLGSPFNRSIEPMQWTAVDLKQKLPYFGKRDADQKVAQADGEVLSQNLEQAKTTLVSAIKSQAYTIWELERLYEIIDEYKDLTRQNIELYESYTTTSNNQHMGIMSAELTLSDLRIKKRRLVSLIKSAYAKLSYLGAQHIDRLEIELDMDGLPLIAVLKEGLNNNSAIALRRAEVDKEHALLERAKLEHYPDIAVQAGYYYRASYDDYLSVGIGVSLPIYGSEDYKEERARRMMLAKESQKADTLLATRAGFQSAYAKMKSAYETYHIIVDEALPQVEHMFDLSSTSISTGGDLFKYIDILEQKLGLDQQRIRAVAAYHQSRAEIGRLSGEMQ